jgi:hypothetical protein
MTPHDDEFQAIDADDALLDSLAAGERADSDPAAELLADIAQATKGLDPRGDAGGSGRRRPRRGGMWGISLGVSIAVAASGGLSAAATDRLPEPVQRFVADVGQAVAPARAAETVATPTVMGPPTTRSGERGDAAGEPTAPQRARTDSRVSWRGAPGSTPAPSADDRGERGDRDDAQPPAADYTSGWSGTGTYSWAAPYSGYPRTSSYSYPAPSPTPTAEPAAPTGPSYPSYPWQGPAPAETSAPAPYTPPTSAPSPTDAPHSGRSGGGHPSSSPRPVAPTPAPTATAPAQPQTSPSPDDGHHRGGGRGR